MFFFFLFLYPKYILLYFFFMLFTLNYNYFYFYFFSLDNISEIMGILSLMIFLMSIFSVKTMSKNMYMLVSLSNFITILFFYSMNLFLFIFFFEMSLIPILFLILGWGYQVERLLASYMLLLYTSFLSFPFIISLFFIKNNSFNFFLFFNNENFFSFQMNLLFCFLFFVKTPIYFFHFWLPKAHVEASVTGSIILAGILLKMGSYGLYRMLFIMKFKYFSLFMWFFLLGSLMSTFVCIMQSDMKSMIAFSSVSHMSLMVFSMMQFSIFSMKGAILLMFIHGISSSLFFFLMNYYYYYFMSRLFYYTQFMISVSKIFSMMMFWVIMMNISLPPMLSFFSEILLFFNLIFLSSKMMIFYVVFMSLLSCYYCIFMLTNMMYGKMKNSYWMMNSMLKSNIFILSFFIFSMNLLILLSLF